MQAELVLDRTAPHRVALTDRTVVADQVLRHHEQRQPLGAGGSAGCAGQHEVHDVVGQVVLTPRDEDLRAVQRIATVAQRPGRRSDGTDIGAGVGLGDLHGAVPFAGHETWQVAPALGLAAPLRQQLDRALRERRTERQSEVAAGEDLLHGHPDDLGEGAAAVVHGERHRTPARAHVLPVRLDGAGRGGHGRGVGVDPTADDVAVTIGRGDDVVDEADELLDHRADGVDVDVVETIRGEQGLDADVAQRVHRAGRSADLGVPTWLGRS